MTITQSWNFRNSYTNRFKRVYTLQSLMKSLINYQKWHLQGYSVDSKQLQQPFFMYCSLLLSGFIKLNDQDDEDNLLLTIGLPPVMGNLWAICNSSLSSSYGDHSVSKCSKYTLNVRKRCSNGSFENPSSNEIILENLPQWTSKNPDQLKHRGDIITDHSPSLSTIVLPFIKSFQHFQEHQEYQLNHYFKV